MRWSDIPFDPSRRVLRQFAVAWTVFFGAMAVWRGAFAGDSTKAIVFAAIALGVGPIGWFFPRLLRPIFVGWMVLAFPIGWLISRCMLAVVYYGVFTPMAIVFRLIGRDRLARRVKPSGDTYWTPKPRADEARRYFRQY